MSEANGVINGNLGKTIAAVMVGLLTVAVIGIWNMNGSLNRIEADIGWLKKSAHTHSKEGGTR